MMWIEKIPALENLYRIAIDYTRKKVTGPYGTDYVINKAVTNEPVINEPAINEPAINTPAINEPAINKPAINEPAINEPAINMPAINEPAIEEVGDALDGIFEDVLEDEIPEPSRNGCKLFLNF
jgi:hypothetical protein